MTVQPRLIANADAAGAVPSAPTSPSPPASRILVWDAAVRLFHWSLVGLVLFAWLTGGSGNHLHEISGSGVAGLLAFRLIWGIVGTRHARFRDFVASPSNVGRYVKDILFNRAARHGGHNPAGGYMIVAMLFCLGVVVVTGYMQLTHRFYGIEWVERVHQLSSNGIMVLVPIHLAGVLVSSWMHQDNLVGAMVSGEKAVQTTTAPVVLEEQTASDRMSMRLQASQGFSALLFLIAAGLFVGWQFTSTRTSTVAETAPAAPPPIAVPQAVQDGAVARAKDKQDYVAGGPDDASQTWLMASGGRLYDNWSASLGQKGPQTTHPAWPATNTATAGEATWRCKSCHGWDYMGRDGQYRTGVNSTGITGLQRAKGRDPSVLIATMGDATHQMTDDILPMHAKYRIALFLSRGQHDASKIVLANGRIKGDVSLGKPVYQSICASCHGFDGRARKLGVSSDQSDSGYKGDPLFVGTKANAGPTEVLHKIRNGHPGAIMVAMRAFPMDVAANLMAYVQTLPTK